MSSFKGFFLFVACIVVLSCSPQKRLERILKNNPYILSSETITVRDTVIIPGIVIDTTVITKQRDTVEIFKDRLYTRIIRNIDTLIVFSESGSDTIYLEKTVPIEKIKVEKLPKLWNPKPLNWILSIFFFTAMTLYLASRQKQ